MYCGSCLRDNALATELISRGHDVMLLPVYTPTLTDEPNVSGDKVFFGGISVYLEQYVPFFRRSPKWIDSLWDSSLMLKLASRRSISTSPKMLGELTVSMLKGDDGFQRKEILKLLDWLMNEGPPDVVSLPYTLLLGLAQPIKEALGRPICCTLQGEDLFLEGLEEPYRSESKELIRANIKHVDAFIAVSNYYAEFMPGYLGIPAEKIRVVPLGINLQGYAQRNTQRSAPFTIGFFARIAPEKGLHVLAESYRRLRARGELSDARLEAAGYLAPECYPIACDITRPRRGSISLLTGKRRTRQDHDPFAVRCAPLPFVNRLGDIKRIGIANRFAAPKKCLAAFENVKLGLGGVHPPAVHPDLEDSFIELRPECGLRVRIKKIGPWSSGNKE